MLESKLTRDEDVLTGEVWWIQDGVGRKRPEKQGAHETVVAATIAPTLNARRSRTDPRKDARSIPARYCQL